MECIKTGCHVQLVEHNSWAYGDAFEWAIDGGPGSLISIYVFRFVAVVFKPVVPYKHFTIHQIEHIFDEGKPVSTVLARNVTNHGYDGVIL